jgi:hypothetical protein
MLVSRDAQLRPARVLIVVGTRPEVIKMSPVARALREDPHVLVSVCVVAQQGQILDQAVAEWQLSPDYRIDLPGDDPRLTCRLAAMLPALADCIDQLQPQVLMVEGDTTTNLAAALAAFYAGVPGAHVEAGLRSGDVRQPFPEEMHRVLVDRIASIHYAPTQGARENLAERWQVGWQQGTSATIEAVSRFGVTLPQVVEGILRSMSSDETPPASIVQQLEIAAQCGLHERVHQSLQTLDDTLLKTGGLVDLVAAATIIGRISAGHIPGLPRDEAGSYPPILAVFRDPKLPLQMAELLRACLDRLEGLEGSEDDSDVMGASDLVHWFNGDLQEVLQDVATAIGEVLGLSRERVRRVVAPLAVGDIAEIHERRGDARLVS